MIKKFTCIKNQGILESALESPIDLKKINLIYGENGKGKSTFTDIFNAISQNAFSVLLKKDQNCRPDIKFLCENGSNYGIQCTDTLSNAAANLVVHVFDENFINDNIYSGLNHEKEHKEQLFSLLIGKKTVELQKQRDSIKNQLSAVTQNEKSLKQSLETSLRNASVTNSNLESILQVDTNAIDKDSSEKELSRVTLQLQDSNKIESRSLLSKIQLELDFKRMEDTLNKSIDNVNQTAIEQTKSHIEKFHLKESWLSEGIKYISDNKEVNQCPLCKSDIEKSPLIEHFFHFFNKEYKELEQSLQEISQKILRQKNSTPQNLHSLLQRNIELIKEWHLQNTVDVEISSLKEELDKYLKELNKQLNIKKKEPLLQIDLSPVNDAYTQLDTLINQYNSQIKNLNQQIQSQKDAVNNINSLRSREKSLQESLFAINNKEELDQYKDLQAQREVLKSNLSTNQEEIKVETKKILDSHGSKINNLLRKFNVNFKIDLSDRIEARLNNNQVAINIELDNNEEAKFTESLSKGDKHTIAFAFWLANLPEDLSQSIIILDDPITSLDDHRRSQTINEILTLSEKSSQIIILTHLKSFSTEAYNAIKRKRSDTEFIPFKLTKRAKTSKLEKWDSFHIDTRSPHLVTLDRMRLCLDKEPQIDDLRDLRASIRLILDEHIRFRYFDQLEPKHQSPETDWVKQCKQKSYPPAIEIYELYEYSNNEHHNFSQTNHSELSGYLKRLFQIINPSTSV
jgi:wobble nucleotide-excising tRNase